MIIYLTYNDQPSGVYWSQVTDVVAYLNALGKQHVRLVALVSGRDFFKTRKVIRSHCPSAWVIPMVPTTKRWRRNTATIAWVCRSLNPSGIICRGPFATWMAQRMRERGLTERVCFDGRGAYAAEWEEYRIIDDDALIAQMRPLEGEAVTTSDFRIAVSHALVAHWRDRYGYRGDAHVVVPCTLGNDAVVDPIAFGPDRTDDAVRLVYSGSTAGWQSFNLLRRLLTRLLDERTNIRVLFLSRPDAHTEDLVKRYPGRVEVRWVGAGDVAAVLRSCDAGILVREDTVTNRVASPTKFAEYLYAGLPVIISADLGDFSALVERERLGVVVTRDGGIDRVERTMPSERLRLMAFAREHFTKGACDEQYRTLLSSLE